MGQMLYKIQFSNQGKLYEIYARKVGQGELYGFIEAEELVLHDNEKMIVDPSEEWLRSEFSGVKKTFIPISTILRIDQVERRGKVKVVSLAKGENVTPFPGAFFPPDGQKD